MFRSPLVFVLAALALSGCAGAEASTTMPPQATASLPCYLPYGTKVALLSPAPGSAGVPAGGAPIVVVASRDLPRSVTLVATDRKGRTTPAATLERVPAPAHAAPVPFRHPVYYRANGVALHAQGHYTVALDDLAQNGCAPYAQIAGDARFST
jgi:hypothetical protein